MKRTLTFLIFIQAILLQAVPSTITEFIKVDQFGYRLNDSKTAIIADPVSGFNSGQSFTPGATYQVRRWSDDMLMFSGSPTAWGGGAEHIQSGDKVWWFDFSSVTTQGEYYIYDVTNDVASYQFKIDDAVYADVMKAAVKSLYFQRCGISKTATNGGSWTDGVCHHGSNQDLTCRSATAQGDPATELDLSGGWHDAGDYNKYVNFTYSTMHEMLFAYMHYPAAFGDDYNIPESGNGVPDILDELMWELDWLKKMQLSDGSVLAKVSVTGFQAASPPSADGAARYYGEAGSSSTATVASIFAHAYLVLKDFPSTLTYANDLLSRAEDAWDWIQANPAYSSYGNTGFSSANPERTVDQQKELRVGAAMLLFAATSDSEYGNFADANYTDIRPIQWTFWYPFQPTIQNIALYYTGVSGASSAVTTAILNNFSSSTTSNNSDMLPSLSAQTDAYRAYVRDDNYVWGSNAVVARTGIMYQNMNLYGLDSGNSATYDNAALDYLHKLHGVNPITKVMLTNASSIGAENSCDEMYHNWFGDGTTYDNAQTGIGAPPAYVTGGANRNYAPDGAYGGTISPPQNQPTQKAYKDWNTSWPQNSWEITENAIYYQAAYIQLLAPYVAASSVLPVEISNLRAETRNNSDIHLTWQVLDFLNVKSLEIERQISGEDFKQLSRLETVNIGSNSFTDYNPAEGINYYRLKTTDTDGSVSYSKIVSGKIRGAFEIDVYPNPTKGELTIVLEAENTLGNLNINILNSRGEVVLRRSQTLFSNEYRAQISLAHLPPGMYWLQTENKSGTKVQKIFLH